MWLLEGFLYSKSAIVALRHTYAYFFARVRVDKEVSHRMYFPSAFEGFFSGTSMLSSYCLFTLSYIVESGMLVRACSSQASHTSSFHKYNKVLRVILSW